MNRRQWMHTSTIAAGTLGLAGLLAPRAGNAQPAPKAADGKKLPPLKITDIKTILTAPAPEP